MEGLTPERAGGMVVGRGNATQGAEQIGFEEAIALVKQHPGAILIRTKNGSCMVRLADGSVLGVSPPTDRADIPPGGREKSVAKLQQDVDRLNRVILIHKNTLDKAHHHLRDKDLEIKQLKAKLEEKEKENYLQNKVIAVRGKLIEELKAEIKILEAKQATSSADELSRIARAGNGKKPKSMLGFGLSNRGAAAGSDNESQPFGGI